MSSTHSQKLFNQAHCSVDVTAKIAINNYLDEHADDHAAREMISALLANVLTHAPGVLSIADVNGIVEKSRLHQL